MIAAEWIIELKRKMILDYPDRSGSFIKNHPVATGILRLVHGRIGMME